MNLKSGVRRGEVTETNVAAVGSFILEFGTLSRLTGDPTFEDAAKRAIRAVWGRAWQIIPATSSSTCRTVISWVAWHPMTR